MKFDFEVGSDEKHTVCFCFNKFWGNLKIVVDGKKIISDFRFISIELVVSYDFRVGEKEIHQVSIKKVRPLLLAGFRSNNYRVYIDGHLYKEYWD